MALRQGRLAAPILQRTKTKLFQSVNTWSMDAVSAMLLLASSEYLESDEALL